MAYDSNELLQDGVDFPFQKRAAATQIQPKTFSAGAGTLEALTPVAFNTTTNQWVVWAQAGLNGTNVIKGFVWPDKVVLAAGGEVLGQVMIAGRVHFADIVLPAGETEANLQAACRSGLRELGIHVEGLSQVR